jgi:hypothetical protein
MLLAQHRISYQPLVCCLPERIFYLARIIFSRILVGFVEGAMYNKLDIKYR